MWLCLLKDSLRTATKWYDSNLLAGNLKNQTMNIGYGQAINSAAPALRVNNEEIKNVENVRLVGVTIDSKFNFTDHISTIFVRKLVKELACLCDLGILSSN